MTFLRSHLSIALICLLVALVYSAGLSGGYVFDDFPNIVRNDRIVIGSLAFDELLRAAFSSESGPLSRPLSMLSFAVERHLYGLNPFPMKLTNVLIHIVNVVLVYLLLQALLMGLQQRNPRVNQWVVSPSALALLVAAGWALAPVNLSSVLYLVQRMESLATLFMLAGMLAYVHGRRRVEAGDEIRGWTWALSGVLGGTIVGGLAKETAVMLPLHVLLIEWLVFGFGGRNQLTRLRLLKLYGLILLLPGVVGVVLYLPGILSGAAFGSRSFSLEERLWTQAHVLWHYLAWIVVPSPGTLGFYHDAFPVARGPLETWTTLPAVFGLAGLIVGAVLLRRRAPVLTLGMLWFFIMHLLVSTIFPLELVFEHRNYLPSVGILLAVFGLVLRGGESSTLAGVRKIMVVVMIAAYGMLCLMRANEWSDPLRHAYFETVQQPESPRAQHALGFVLTVLSPDPHSVQFQEATNRLELAASLPGSSLSPMQALIFEHGKHGLPIASQWWKQMRAYVRTNPLRAQDLTALSSLLHAQSSGVIRIDTDELGALLRETMDHHPRRSQVVAMYARYLFSVAGNAEEAGRLLQRAVALAPRSAIRWGELVQYQIVVGQHVQARNGLLRLRELNRFGRWDALIESLERQLALVPGVAGSAESGL